MSNDISVFLVNSSCDIHDSSLFIGDKGILIFEELPPSWSCWSASHIVALHVKWVRFPVVVIKSLGCWVEEPLLSSNILSPSLEPNIVCSVTFSNSLEWKSWSNVEWSIDMESIVFIESLWWNWLSLVHIHHWPFLISSLVVTHSIYWLSFLIFVIPYMKYLSVVPINKLLILELEDLPPSRVGAPDLHVSSSSWTSDVEGLVVQSGSDSQRCLMEVPFLGVSSIWNLNYHVSIVDQVKVSVLW